MPRPCLGEIRIEIEKQVSIREVQKLRGTVAHQIHGACDEVLQWDISMTALMKGLETKEVGDGAHSGRCTLSLPGDSGGVVAEVVHSVVKNVHVLSKDVKLSN
jgi:hypothetical protein